MPAPTTNKKKQQHAGSNKKHQGRKRPRSNTNKDEEQQQAYYDRLMYQCRKELHKQAKQTKTFITQKLIRKLKDTATSSSATSLKQQQHKLQQVKDYVLEPVLEECFRRLGLRQLDPQLQQKSFRKEDEEEAEEPSNKADAGDNDDDINKQQSDSEIHQQKYEEQRNMDDKAGKQNSNTIGTVGSGTKQQQEENAAPIEKAMSTTWILERILQHKRMVVALEHWNDQVTEYRRWCLQQQERAEGLDTIIAPKKKDKKKRKLRDDNAYEQDALVAADHSVFVTLGGDDSTQATTAALPTSTDNYYGPASDGTLPVKKNRKGQRARRAKAQAIEARKAGRLLRPEESLNWRRPSNRHEQSSSHDPQQQQHASSTHQPPSENPKDLHPSWQARKEKKDGIVAFQGKKMYLSSNMWVTF